MSAHTVLLGGIGGAGGAGGAGGSGSGSAAWLSRGGPLTPRTPRTPAGTALTPTGAGAGAGGAPPRPSAQLGAFADYRAACRRCCAMALVDLTPGGRHVACARCLTCDWSQDGASLTPSTTAAFVSASQTLLSQVWLPASPAAKTAMSPPAAHRRTACLSEAERERAAMAPARYDDQVAECAACRRWGVREHADGSRVCQLCGTAHERGDGAATCFHCRARSVRHLADGSRACQACGTVHELAVISDAPEWRSFADDDGGGVVDKARVGPPCLDSAGGANQRVGELLIAAGASRGVRSAQRATGSRAPTQLASEDARIIDRVMRDILQLQDAECDAGVKHVADLRRCNWKYLVAQKRASGLAAILMMATSGRALVERLSASRAGALMDADAQAVRTAYQDGTGLLRLKGIARLPSSIPFGWGIVSDFPAFPQDALPDHLRRPMTTFMLDMVNCIDAFMDGASGKHPVELQKSVCMFAWEHVVQRPESMPKETHHAVLDLLGIPRATYERHQKEVIIKGWLSRCAKLGTDSDIAAYVRTVCAHSKLASAHSKLASAHSKLASAHPSKRAKC